MASKANSVSFLKARQGIQILEYFESKPRSALHWATIHDAIKYCADNMNAVAALFGSEWLKRGVPHSDTIVNYVAGVGEFVINNEKPLTSSNVWYSMLLPELLKGVTKEDSITLKSNVGTTAFMVQTTGNSPATAGRHLSTRVSDKVRSYSDHHEILLGLWLSRENGLDDMLRAVTIALLVKSF